MTTVRIFFLAVLVPLFCAADKSNEYKITPEDMAKLIKAFTPADERPKLKKEVESYEAELVELSKLKDKNKIGEAEFALRCKMLEDKRNRTALHLSSIAQSSQNMENNVQTVLMEAWKTGLKMHEEEGQRKTAIAQTAVQSAIRNQGKIEELKFMTDPNTLIRSGAFLSVTSIVMYGSYLGLQYGYKKLGLPELEKEAFSKGLTTTVSEFLFGKEKKDLSFFDDIILPEQLNNQLLKYADQTRNSNERGLPHRHLLLHGKPGTGKTMFARKFARYVDMDFLEIPGGNWAMLDEPQRIAKFTAIAKKAQQSRNGLALYIDEAETLFAKKNALTSNNDQFLNTVLAYTGTSASSDENALAHKLVMIISTNDPSVIAPAILSRFNQQIYIPLPGVEERKKMNKQYFDLYITNDTRVNKRTGQQLSLTVAPDVTPALLDDTASIMDEWSGREIDQLFDELRAQAYGSDNMMVDKALFDHVLNEKIERHKNMQQIMS